MIFMRQPVSHDRSTRFTLGSSLAAMLKLGIVVSEKVKEKDIESESEIGKGIVRKYRDGRKIGEVEWGKIMRDIDDKTRDLATLSMKDFVDRLIGSRHMANRESTSGTSSIGTNSHPVGLEWLGSGGEKGLADLVKTEIRELKIKAERPDLKDEIKELKEKNERLEKKVEELNEKIIDLVGDYREYKGRIETINTVSEQNKNINKKVRSDLRKMKRRENKAKGREGRKEVVSNSSDGRQLTITPVSTALKRDTVINVVRKK